LIAGFGGQEDATPSTNLDIAAGEKNI